MAVGQVIGSGTDGVTQVNGDSQVYRNGKPVDPGSQTTSSVTPPPSINEERELQRSITAVNTSLQLSTDGTKIVTGLPKLNTLGQALKNTEQTAELSKSVLTRGLSDPNDPNLQAQAIKTLQAELSKEQYGGKIKLPKEAEGAGAPKLAEKEDKKPKLENTLILNDNEKGGASTLKVMNPTGEGTQHYDVFYEAEQKENAPAVSIFKNTKEPGIAYVVVSRRSADGKIESTEVAAVSSADALGTEGNRPSNLGARIFTKDGKEQIGTMNLSGLDLGAMQAKLKEELKQPETPKTPEKPADAGNGGNSPAPGSGAQESGGQSGDRAGAGSGSQSPAPNGGTPTTPPNPTEIKPDGKLDKSEMMRFLTEVGKSSGSGSVTDKIRKQFLDSTVTGDAEKTTLNFEGPENPKVTIYWKNGSAGVDFNGDEERKKVWIKQFEQRVKAIVADPNSEPSASASRLMGNPSAVKDLLQRPYVFLSLQAAFGERNVSRDGTDIVVRDLIPFRNVHLKPSGKIELRQAGLFLPELPDAARTAELTAEVENRLRKFNGGLAKLGDSQGFNQDDKKAVKAWLSGQNADEFKKRLGDGFSTLDNGIKFRTTGYEFIIQESGTVGVRKIEGPFGGSRRPITGGLDLTKAKAVLEGVMADTR